MSNVQLISILTNRRPGLFNDFNIEYNATSNRVRCMGHIINLSAQSFLFSNHADALEDFPFTLHDREKYRKLGPLGKLHNFIVSIGRTPQRKQQWKLIARGKWISRDNSTQRNSSEKMLSGAVPLRKCIDRYFEQYADEHLCQDRLSDEDWVNLVKVRGCIVALSRYRLT